MDEHQTSNPNSSTRQEIHDTDPFIEERLNQMNIPLPPPPFVPYAYKSKLMAGLLAFFIPGTGHLYLGMMQKGLQIMMLIVIDICLIIAFNSERNTENPVQTFFGLMLPVIYFYNLFDTMHSTEKVNARNAFLYQGDSYNGHIHNGFDEPVGQIFTSKKTGLLLIAGGIMIFLFSIKPQWFSELLHLMNSYLGAFVLIGIGIFMFLHKKK
ncbi:hypothetical protein GC093_00270 [Paenibacillus sp. LMG 31456]|uniref:Uncharacterized protein n=1 Tax=Paenibacillus foliorum TaxID=2654974 RepID=A0A972JWR0_9BACL|nr:DUF6677 family protein [Paenibacillus foliorum]NOU91674.1 hypothetical protein [Paenibacillus foliorum]